MTIIDNKSLFLKLLNLIIAQYPVLIVASKNMNQNLVNKIELTPPPPPKFAKVIDFNDFIYINCFAQSSSTDHVTSWNKISVAEWHLILCEAR